MKKTIILILVLLPIVLLMVIAVAGRILSIYRHISVESVEFIDRIGNVYTSDLSFTVAQDETKETYIRIYPELASNKKVTYTSSATDICTVDENGVVTGVHFGTAVITVKTKDSSKTATLNVTVTADVPFGVTLSESEKSLIPGETFTLTEAVDAPVAMDKHVGWSSSDESVVRVDSLGNVIAVAPGEAFVTVTTRLGGKTASCKITVQDVQPPVSFDFSQMDGTVVKENGVIIYSKSVNLAAAVKLGDDVTADRISLSADSTNIATLDGWVLSRREDCLEGGIVTLTVQVNNGETVYYTTQILLMFV